MINIAKILSEKPKSTKLYSPMIGKCQLVRIKETGDHPIVVIDTIMHVTSFTANGRYSKDTIGECMLFPSKEMMDWDKFAWEKGDIVINIGENFAVSFDGWKNDDYTEFICEDSFIAYPDGKITEIDREKTIYKTSDFRSSALYDMNIVNNSKFISKVKQSLWKKGDVLISKGQTKSYCIFKESCENNPIVFWAEYYFVEKSIISGSVLLNTEFWRRASKEESITFIDYLERNYNGKFNVETLEFEKPNLNNKFKLLPFDKIVAKQFLKELWHNAKEEPGINKRIILEHLKDGYVNSYNSIMWRGKISWSDFLEDHDFISRWFYIDDLL